MRYCFLTILNHFKWCTVYSTKCSLFICKYLFIYLFGLWFWMHIYAYILNYMLLSLMWRLYCYSNLAKIYFSVLSLPWVFFSFFFSTSILPMLKSGIYRIPSLLHHRSKTSQERAPDPMNLCNILTLDSLASAQLYTMKRLLMCFFIKRNYTHCGWMLENKDWHQQGCHGWSNVYCYWMAKVSPYCFSWWTSFNICLHQEVVEVLRFFTHVKVLMPCPKILHYLELRKSIVSAVHSGTYQKLKT